MSRFARLQMNIGELFLSQDICCVQITDNKNLLIIYEHNL